VMYGYLLFLQLIETNIMSFSLMIFQNIHVCFLFKINLMCLAHLLNSNAWLKTSSPLKSNNYKQMGVVNISLSTHGILHKVTCPYTS
jgi:hypothetical protein